MAELTMKDGISAILRQGYSLPNLKATWLQTNREETLEECPEQELCIMNRLTAIMLVSTATFTLAPAVACVRTWRIIATGP
jgi:hypothetical protein